MVFKEILKWLQIYWIPHEKHSFFFFLNSKYVVPSPGIKFFQSQTELKK